MTDSCTEFSLEQEAIQAASSGMYSKYNGPNANGQPKPYITKENFIDLMPEEAFYEMKSMLFDSVDSTVIVDFLMRVREFSAEYRVQVSDAVRSIVTMRDSRECGIRKRKQFDAARSLGGGSGCDGRPIVVKESVFQLVPGVSSSACSGVKQAVWRHGYWHIARSQVCVCFFKLLYSAEHIQRVCVCVL